MKTDIKTAQNINMAVKSKKAQLTKIFMYSILTLFSVGQIFPLVWLVNFSIVKSGELFGANILVWPTNPQWGNYSIAWIDGKIPEYFINSFIVNVATVALTVILSLMMGYTFSRMQWKLRKVTMTYILLGMMIPVHATLLPTFFIFSRIGLRDSHWALIIPYVAFALPLAVFIMTGFMESLPKSLEESAVMDGAGVLRIIFALIFPLTKPAMVTVVIMTFLNTWNEFIMAATYISSDKYRTLPFAVYNFAGQYASNYSVQFAVMTLVALPSIIIYILLNEQITKGVTEGALKG